MLTKDLYFAHKNKDEKSRAPRYGVARDDSLFINCSS